MLLQKGGKTRFEIGKWFYDSRTDMGFNLKLNLWILGFSKRSVSWPPHCRQHRGKALLRPEFLDYVLTRLKRLGLKNLGKNFSFYFKTQTCINHHRTCLKILDTFTILKPSIHRLSFKLKPISVRLS